MKSKDMIWNFDKKVMITFVIGLLIGASIIGIADIKRPQPLFSSADAGVPTQCLGEYTDLIGYIEQLFSTQPPLTSSEYADWIYEVWEPGIDAYRTCYDEQHDFFVDAVRTAQDAYQAFLETYTGTPEPWQDQRAQELFDAWRQAQADLYECSCDGEVNFPDLPPYTPGGIGTLSQPISGPGSGNAKGIRGKSDRGAY